MATTYEVEIAREVDPEDLADEATLMFRLAQAVRHHFPDAEEHPLVIVKRKDP